jgi:hypothetical protein
MPITIEVNQRVEDLHQGGVTLAKAGEIDRARGQYDSAKEELFRAGYPELFEASSQLHQARIQRDRGFLAAHHLSHGGRGQEWRIAVDHINDGLHVVKGSRSMTGSLLGLGIDKFTEGSWQRLQSEHGATIGTQARLVLLRSVVKGATKTELKETLSLFEEAEEHLAQGDKAYYGASNAVRSAGVERLADHPLQAARWIGRSMLYPLATSHSLKDSAGSALTIGRNGLDLRSKKAVAEGIRAHP